MEQLYYKPHFGPEETYERAMCAETKTKTMKEQVRKSLQRQMDEAVAVSEASRREEREADRQCLKAQADNQFVENFAMARKNDQMK